MSCAGVRCTSVVVDEVDRTTLHQVVIDLGVHGDSGELFTLITQQGLGFDNLTRAKNSWGVAGCTVNSQTRISSRAVVIDSAEHASQTGQQILLTLVGDVISDLGANGSHGIRTRSQSSQIPGLESATTMQNSSDLLVCGDLARDQG